MKFWVVVCWAVCSACGAELAAVPVSAPRIKHDPVELLDEILRSKNDNDPRLDTAFNTLSEATKRLFRKRYYALAPEMRNERGTVVFLLGKNMRSQEDWDFLKAVVDEPPCLSLANCRLSKPSEAALGDPITRAYPALVALRQAAQKAKSRSASELDKRNVQRIFQRAKRSRIFAVSKLATDLAK